MSDEQERPNPEIEDPQQEPQPQEDEELGTVSLLDLMADADVPETIVLQPKALAQPAEAHPTAPRPRVPS